MSQATCPTCEQAIDPTHAPVARIVGASIVTFCSKACAAGKPAVAATAAPVTPTPAPAAVVATTTDLDWELDEDELDPAAEPEPDPEPDLEPAAPTPRPAPVAVEPEDSSVWQLRPRRGRKRKTVIAVSGVILAGGMALAIIDGVSPTRSSSVSASEPPAPAPSPLASTAADDTARAKSTPDTVVEPVVLRRAATTALRELRSSPSRRVVRLATMALARTGDKDAIDGITELLESEESALNRIALAHSLARAGHDRGHQVLREGLSHKRRDVRSDAAIGLLNIGDDGGLKTLRGMMSYRHHKIAACGHLAKAGDAKAKSVLEGIYRDRKSDPESKLRAAVALGRSGDKSVAEFLRGTLTDGRFQVGAADALATLGDRSSIEPLTVQLGLNAMRVRAAVALRSLDADVSLEPLAVALTEDDEVTRVTAAEAIIILTGTVEAARD